jgi:hypothetical protein
MLRAGLKKARTGSTRAMRWKVSVEHPAGELGDGSAEINSAIFHDHFKQLYGRLPPGKMGVLQHVEQQRVFTGLYHEPTEAEILEAVLGKHGRGGLNCSGPGDTGAAAAEWKSGLLVYIYTCTIHGVYGRPMWHLATCTTPTDERRNKARANSTAQYLSMSVTHAAQPSAGRPQLSALTCSAAASAHASVLG